MNEHLNDHAVLTRRLRQAMQDRLHREQVVFLTRGAAPDVYTGERLLKESEAMANTLRGWLGSGDQTLVLALPAGNQFVVCTIACIFADITIVPVAIPRSGSHSDRFSHIVADCRASGVVCLPLNRERIAKALSQAPELGACPVVELPLAPAELPGPMPKRRPTDRSAPAVIQYTSGSTRLPKGVRIMPGNIVVNGDAMGRNWQLDQAPRIVNWLPHFHDMGLMSGILYPFLWGGVSFQMSPQTFIRNPKAWLRAISDHKATFSGSPAFGYAECCRRIAPEDVEDLDLSSWQQGLCGAEPVPVGLLETFYQKFKSLGLGRNVLIPGYGMAEYTLFAAGVAGNQFSGPSSAGLGVQPCLLNDETRSNICIVDPDSRQPMEEGEIGEIWLRGPSVGDGYHMLASDTDEIFGQRLAIGGKAEWLRSGDLGTIRGNAFWITGRLKDIVICNGSKISAPEIEHLACNLYPDLNALAAAVFMPDESESGRAVLIVELLAGRDTGKIDKQSMHKDIQRILKGEWGLDLVEFIVVPRSRLARTSSGKIQRRKVAETYRKGGFASFH